MNATPHAKFVPVLPRRRRDWEIPAVDAYERLVEERRKEARLKARWAGTTPYGREIFRRMLQRAWTLCEKNKSMPEVILQLEAELQNFFELRQEFILMLSKLDTSEVQTSEVQGSEVETYQDVSWYGMATLLVLRSRCWQQLQQKQAAEPGGALAPIGQ